MDKIEEWHGNRTKVPEGRYHIRFIKGEAAKVWHQGGGGWAKSEKVILWFEIVEGEHMGKAVPAFLVSKDHKKRISQGSKYFQFWIVANGMKRPLSPKIRDMPISKFNHKSFMAQVVDVTPKWIVEGQSVEQPPIFKYSRVDLLFELLTGDPHS